MTRGVSMEHVLLFVGLLAVFALVFFLGQGLLKPQDESVLDGVRVIGSRTEFSALLSEDPVLIEMALFAGNDTRNTALTGVTAEIASTLVKYGRKTGVYGSIDGNASVNCVKETNFCKGAVVSVRIGPCNCLRAEKSRIVVEATPEFLADFSHVKVYKGIFGLSVAG